MEIPVEFKIFGQTISIKRDTELVEKNDTVGEARYRRGEIVLQCHDKLSRPESQFEQIYMHEVVHHVLFHLGYYKLNDDELFVDQMANALHQVLTTSAYEKKKKTRK